MAETKQVLSFTKGVKKTANIVEPDYALSSQTVTDTTNAQGVVDRPSREDHTHAHGNLITPTHHALVTPVAHGFMSSVDKTKLDKIVYEVLQYNNAGTTTTSSGAGVALSMGTDRESQAGTLLTKPLASVFRTNFDGRVSISFRGNVDNDDGTGRPGVLWIRRAGTDLLWTTVFAHGRASTTRLATGSDTVDLNCSVGDNFQLMFAPYQDGRPVSIRADDALLTIRAVRLA